MPKWGVVYHQMVKLQRRIHERCMDEKCSNRDLAQLSKAFESLEVRKRVIRMKPNPKAIDVSKMINARRPKVDTPSFESPPD